MIGLAAVLFIVGPLVVLVVTAATRPDVTTNPRPPASSASDGPTGSTSPTSYSTYSGTPDPFPDDPPVPTTYAQVHQILESSPLYSQRLAATQCQIPDVDLASASTREIETHLNKYVSCLMAAWDTPVRSAGFSLPHPSVTVYTTEVTSPCGDLPMQNAIYCSADQQIYYAKDLASVFPRNHSLRLVGEAVIAHEFAHAVQYRTMILMSAAALEAIATTEPEEFDLSRRLEMQADCFAGVFLNSISDSAGLSTADRQRVLDLFTTLGGTVPYDDDHGTGANRAYWTSQGLGSLRLQTCTTFTAPADRVS